MHRLRNLSSPVLAASVVAIDAMLWASVVPFEFWAHGAATVQHPSNLVLVGILAVNAMFLSGMIAAGAATVELMRRGVTLRRLVPPMRRFAALKIRVPE